MIDPHDLPMEEYHRALGEMVRGNPEGYKKLCSRRDDVTWANPFGPPVRGWDAVSATLDRAASNFRDGEGCEFENISMVITPELAYTVEIQRLPARGRSVEGRAPTRRPDHHDGGWAAQGAVMSRNDPRTAMPQQVDFFFDFVSPYTYLAQTQSPALDADGGNAASPGSVLGG